MSTRLTGLAAIFLTICSWPGSAAQVAGKLVVPEGAAASDWRVAAMAAPTSRLPERLDLAPIAADGSFAVDVPEPGKTWLVAYLGPWLDPSSPLTVPADSLDRPVQMTSQGRRAEFVMTVLGPDRRPLAGAVRAYLIGAYGRYDAQPTGTPVDASGEARWLGLPAGSYDLWMDTVSGGDEVLGAAALLSRQVKVTAGSDRQSLEVVLPPAGALQGRLLLANGQPAAGWTLSTMTGAEPAADDPAPMAAYASGAVAAYSWATVADDGSFTLGSLPEGPVVLDARRPGETRAWWSFDSLVKAGVVSQLGEQTVPGSSWRYLFDGHSMAGWQDADLWGHKPAWAAGDRLYIPAGDDMSGVNLAPPNVPSWDYEVTFEGQRTAGNDFWAGLTFPVGEDPLTLILGGWGGAVTGLSSIDGADASENQSNVYIAYENWRWYRVRLAVTKERVKVWIDDQLRINQPLADHRLSIRWEVEPSRPFGFATWNTASALRDIRLRPLPPASSAENG